LIDIMLMSASTNDVLAHGERLFDNSAVTPAARANDATDIFAVRHGRYIAEPSQPFRSAALDHIQCGHVDCEPAERSRGTNLGLYSVTFNNNLDDDLVSLEQYRRFREEAERKGFRHFLEVFDPNLPQGLTADTAPQFINDCIARTLAGVASAGRPIFLKIVYHGPRAMEELVSYDPHLVVGILGGSAGTTYDAFKLIAEAQKHGARAALFGRKINNAESQLAFVEFLRRIVDREISPEDAVRAYHAVLERLKIKPHRSLADDMQLHSGVMSYGGSSSVSVPRSIGAAAKPSSPSKPSAEKKHDCGCGGPSAQECQCHDKPKTAAAAPVPSGTPDFSKMTRAEKLAYNQARRDRIFG
jgi:hypothetical protein